jgi:hypothetical protein
MYNLTDLEENQKRCESSIELPNKAMNSDDSDLLLSVLTNDRDGGYRRHNCGVGFTFIDTVVPISVCNEGYHW